MSIVILALFIGAGIGVMGGILITSNKVAALYDQLHNQCSSCPFIKNPTDNHLTS